MLDTSLIKRANLIPSTSLLQNIAEGKITVPQQTSPSVDNTTNTQQNTTNTQQAALDAFKAEMSTLFESEMKSDWDKFSEKHGDGFSSYPSKTKLLEVVSAIISNATSGSTEESLRSAIHETNAYKNMKNAAESELSSYKTKRNLAIGGGVLLVGGIAAFMILKKK